jgi:hypothetical protein
MPKRFGMILLKPCKRKVGHRILLVSADRWESQ